MVPSLNAALKGKTDQLNDLFSVLQRYFLTIRNHYDDYIRTNFTKQTMDCTPFRAVDSWSTSQRTLPC